jgi:hypothetical protein
MGNTVLAIEGILLVDRRSSASLKLVAVAAVRIAVDTVPLDQVRCLRIPLGTGLASVRVAVELR